jgi:hypothetical protein
MRRTILFAFVLALAAGLHAPPAGATADVFGCAITREQPGGSSNCRYVAATTVGRLTLTSLEGSASAWVYCGHVHDGTWLRASLHSDGSETYDQMPGEFCYVYVSTAVVGDFAVAQGDNVV